MAVTINGTTGVSKVQDGLSNVGKVLQVKETLKTDTSYHSSIGSSPQAIAGMSCTITPTSTTSKIKIEVRWMGECSEQYNLMFQILRGSTSINLPPVAGSRQRGLFCPALSYAYSDNSTTPEAASFSTIDYPNTTGSITYSLAVVGDGNDSMWTNRTYVDGDAIHHERGTSEIILTEIGGS